MALKAVTWDDDIKGYRYTQSGKKLSLSATRKYVDYDIERYRIQARRQIDLLADNQINFEDWQRNTAKIIKNAHLRAMEFSRGGKDKTFANHYLASGRKIKDQYGFLRDGLASDILQGKVSRSQGKARITNYVNSAFISFEEGRASYQEQSVAYRRRLGSCFPHCQPCINYAMAGWRPISELILPGEKCDCNSNCCCSVEYANQQEFESQATPETYIGYLLPNSN